MTSTTSKTPPFNAGFLKGAAIVMLLLGGVAVATPAAADPPGWAPAHGYEKSHGKKYKHHKKHGYKYGHHHHHKTGPHEAGADFGALPQPVFIDRGPDLSCDRVALSGSKTLVGQILGGVGGAVLGSQFGQGTGKLAATAGGTLIGVLIGGGIGGSLDAADAACAQHALEAAPDGAQVAWVDPNRNTRYAVTPTQTYRNDQGRFCREYSTTAQIGQRIREVQGVACRDAAGGWEIQS